LYDWFFLIGRLIVRASEFFGEFWSSGLLFAAKCLGTSSKFPSKIGCLRALPGNRQRRLISGMGGWLGVVDIATRSPFYYFLARQSPPKPWPGHSTCYELHPMSAKFAELGYSGFDVFLSLPYCWAARKAQSAKLTIQGIPRSNVLLLFPTAKCSGCR